MIPKDIGAMLSNVKCLNQYKPLSVASTTVIELKL